jgi:hypothetical protein
MDVTDLTPYTVAANGCGMLLDNLFAASSNGQLFLGSGLTTGDTGRYELFMGVQESPVSGTGMFLNPQGVFNVFSFAPAGNPVAPGEFITVYGSGLPATYRCAGAVPHHSKHHTAFDRQYAGAPVFNNFDASLCRGAICSDRPFGDYRPFEQWRAVEHHRCPGSGLVAGHCSDCAKRLGCRRDTRTPMEGSFPRRVLHRAVRRW